MASGPLEKFQDTPLIPESALYSRPDQPSAACGASALPKTHKDDTCPVSVQSAIYTDLKKWSSVLHSQLRELATPKPCVGSDQTRSLWKVEFILSRFKKRSNIEQHDVILSTREAISNTWLLFLSRLKHWQMNPLCDITTTRGSGKLLDLNLLTLPKPFRAHVSLQDMVHVFSPLRRKPETMRKIGGSLRISELLRTLSRASDRKKDGASRMPNTWPVLRVSVYRWSKMASSDYLHCQTTGWTLYRDVVAGSVL